MKKYIVNMVDAYTREVLEYNVDDEVFDAVEQAEWFASDCDCAMRTGAEVLELAGDDFTNPEDVDFEVEEIDE